VVPIQEPFVNQVFDGAQQVLRAARQGVAAIFGVLIMRAVRTDSADVEQQRAKRHRQVARLIEGDRNGWLFSTGSESANAKARLRFEQVGEQIVFRGFGLSLPVEGSYRLPLLYRRPAHGSMRESTCAGRPSAQQPLGHGHGSAQTTGQPAKKPDHQAKETVQQIHHVGHASDEVGRGANQITERRARLAVDAK
jgi:hypothetical protein